MARPLILQAFLASVLLVGVTLAVVLLRNSDQGARPDGIWRDAIEERLARVEKAAAARGVRESSATPARVRDVGVAAKEAPAAGVGEAVGADGVEIEELREEVEALALRVEGLEEDPIQRGYSFVSSDSDELRREGIRMLRRVARFDPQARAAIRELLRDPSARVRAEALEAIGEELRDKESLPGVLSLLEDSERDVRRRAIQALGSIGDAASGLAVAQQLNDPDERIREEAADALGRLKTPEAGANLIKALRDPNESVRGQAIASLGEMEHKEAASALRAMYDGEPGQHRMRLVLALRRMGDEQPFRREIDRLSQAATSDSDERARARAVNQLADLARRDAQGVFEQALQDSSASVREAAQRALRRRE